TVQHDLDLLTRRLQPTGKKQSLPEHDYTFALPMVEMAKKHLLIDERDQAHNLKLACSGNLQVEGASDMQRFKFFHPRERDLIVCPGASNGDRDLVIAIALEAPVVGARDMLDNIHRVGIS